MAWERVGGGPLPSGGRSVVERHVLDVAWPKAGVVPIRLRSYRWRLIGPDGTSSVMDRARSRDDIEASLRTYLLATPEP